VKRPSNLPYTLKDYEYLRYISLVLGFPSGSPSMLGPNYPSISKIMSEIRATVIGPLGTAYRSLLIEEFILGKLREGIDITKLDDALSHASDTLHAL